MITLPTVTTTGATTAVQPSIPRGTEVRAAHLFAGSGGSWGSTSIKLQISSNGTDWADLRPQGISSIVSFTTDLSGHHTFWIPSGSYIRCFATGGTGISVQVRLL